MGKIVEKLAKVAADKWLHFIVGMILAQLTIVVLSLFVADKFVVYGAGMAVALAAGFMKELKDGKHADAADFVFTLVGGIVGALIALALFAVG